VKKRSFAVHLPRFACWAVLALWVASLAGCESLANLGMPSNTNCTATRFQLIQVPYCSVMGNGYCQVTSYRSVSGNVCSAWACKPGFAAPDGNASNGCYAGDEYEKRRRPLAEKEARRAQRAQVEEAERTRGGQGNLGSGETGSLMFSADGRSVLFESRATNLVAVKATQRVLLLKELRSGALRLASANARGEPADIALGGGSFSPDGSKVLFASQSTNLVATPSQDMQIYVKDLRSGSLTRVSASASGTAGDKPSHSPAWAPDGNRVVFSSGAGSLVGGEPFISEILIKDLRTGAVSMASTTPEGKRLGGFEPQFSPDGSLLAFQNFDPGTKWDQALTVKTLRGGRTTMVRLVADGEPPEPAGRTRRLQRYTFMPGSNRILFVRWVSSEFGRDPKADLLMHDLRTGTTTLVQANVGSNTLAVSPDGASVAFGSEATNLVSGDTNKHADVFIKNLRSGVVTRINIKADERVGAP
jgi:dipeptidyl aminopeptidase/acylaminoacyl peptidase